MAEEGQKKQRLTRQLLDGRSAGGHQANGAGTGEFPPQWWIQSCRIAAEVAEGINQREHTVARASMTPTPCVERDQPASEIVSFGLEDLANRQHEQACCRHALQEPAGP